jgi:hypothetical protein
VKRSQRTQANRERQQNRTIDHLAWLLKSLRKEKRAQDRQGFRAILVTEPTHPYINKWRPPGRIIGYEHSFTHTIADFVNAVVAGKKRASNLRGRFAKPARARGPK